jgi:lysosomal alpha-mannosidase
VGPIDISDGLGKEVISRFDTDVNSGDQWGTDVNGMLMAARMRNNRSRLWYSDGETGQLPAPDYFECTEPVACNYFAVNGIASLTDKASPPPASAASGGNSSASARSASQPRRRLSVLTDRYSLLIAYSLY